MTQVTPENFLKTVDDAFNNHVQASRDANQQALELFMQNNSDAFVEICGHEFQKADNNVQMRVIVSTLLKNSIAPNSESERPSIWSRINEKSKQTAKTTGLMLLVDSSDIVKKAAASLISKIFAVDWLTDKSWGDLIAVISGNLRNDNKEVRKAAMLTLGYICEDLNQYGIRDLPSDQVEFLLGGICEGLATYDDLTNTALMALSNSTNFLADRLQTESITDYIFNLLFGVLVEAKKVSNVEIIINTLNLLGEICKLVYTNIKKYEQLLIDQVLECYNFDVLIQVNEFFSTLAACEQIDRKGVFDSNWNKIVDQAFKVLLSLDANEDEDSGLSKHQSVLLLFTSINSIVASQSLDYMVKIFVYYIEQEDEKSKIAALIVFESAIESSADIIYSQIDNAFFLLLNFVTMGSPKIKMHSVRVLSKIAKESTSVFLTDHNFLKAHDTFKTVLAAPAVDEDLVIVKKLICACYENLADNYPKLPKTKVETFKSYSNDIIVTMMSSVNQNSDVTYLDTVFSSLFFFLGNVIDAKQLDDYFLSFFNHLNVVCTSFHGNSKIQAITHILIDLSVIMGRYQTANRSFSDVTSERLIGAYDYVIALISTCPEISSEGIIVLANLICLQPELFKAHIDNFVQIYAVTALKDANNFELFKAGVESIGMLAKYVGPALSAYISEILSFLLRNLCSNTLKQDLRVFCFLTISDICLHYPQIAIEQLQDVVSTLEMAFDAVLVLQRSNDPEYVEYADSLKETVLDCYLCIIHGIYYETKVADGILENAFKKLTDFIRSTVASELNPKIDYLKNCLNLMVDIYGRNKNFDVVDRNLVQGVYEILDKVRHVTGIDETLSYAFASCLSQNN